MTREFFLGLMERMEAKVGTLVDEMKEQLLRELYEEMANDGSVVGPTDLVRRLREIEPDLPLEAADMVHDSLKKYFDWFPDLQWRDLGGYLFVLYHGPLPDDIAGAI